MKVVLDTNVVMSALFFGGLPGQILHAWIAGRVKVVASPAILEEYRRVAETLARQYRAPDVSGLLGFMAVEAEIVQPPALPVTVSRDPDDDKFLTCARAGVAAVVVSGDNDLLSLANWEGVAILSPRQFVEAYLGAP